MCKLGTTMCSLFRQIVNLVSEKKEKRMNNGRIANENIKNVAVHEIHVLYVANT